MPDIVSKLFLAAIWSLCSVQYKFEQAPFSRGGLLFRSAALCRIQFSTCWFIPMPCFYSETNEWLKRLSKSMSTALLSNNFSPIWLKTLFHMTKKSDLLLPKIYKALNPFWRKFDSQYLKNGITFSSSKLLAASSYCSKIGNSLCLPVRPSKAVPERCPKSPALDFVVKTFACLLL